MLKKISTRALPVILGALLLHSPATSAANTALQSLQAGWQKPARTFKPHTRWWWPGNALTKADITFQLEEMAAQGLGGVEIMSGFRMYETGNTAFLSPEFLDLVKHAVTEAKRLDLEVAITFGPGWSFGGPWVKLEDQSKSLCLGSVEIAGGNRFTGELPPPQFNRKPGWLAHSLPVPPGNGKLIAVVAARVTGTNQLDASSLTVLTKKIKPGTTALAWDVPPGRWQLMAFWLKPTGQENQAQSGAQPSMIVDHMNPAAVRRYCDYLGGTLAQSLGTEFGRTVDSFFCDSFEIMPLANSILWSEATLAGFEKHAGYDLTKFLPAIWFDLGPETPRLRYDLGDYLNAVGLKTIFQTFTDWCAAHHVEARIQPHYRYIEELVQGAGATARPETELTTTRFEPVADPRKATASGARFYGRDIVSAEAYTFIRKTRYSTDLLGLKIATDAFLRDGVTQFYNHGYFASPEMHVAPSRDMPWASRISHWNTWWKYYHHLAGYIARSCSVLRQGRLVADVLIYSPQATAWSERSLWGTDRRTMPYGDLAKTLVANGYDFDIVNDDLLQHHAKSGNGKIEINNHAYRILLLPRATVLPIETARALRDFAQAGGTIIALEELPSASAGLKNAARNDRELKQIVARLFAEKSSGVFLPDYKLISPPLDPKAQPPTQPTPPLTAPQRQLLAAIARVTPPDFALPGHAQSDGLTFIHKRVADVDVYFVCNLQTNRFAGKVTCRVTGKTPQRWDAVTGETGLPVDFRSSPDDTAVALELEPWASSFLVFTPGVTAPKPAQLAPALSKPTSNISTNNIKIATWDATTIKWWGRIPIAGDWKMQLAGYGFDAFETNLTTLASWTDAPRTRHFSGTGRYEIEFDLPAERLVPGARMTLDLGAVGDVAEVELNGQPVGVAWMPPYRLDLTRAARPGKNKLVVFVTNQLINYVSGLKEPPEVPAELQPRLGKSNLALYEESKRYKNEMSETNLPPSGLLGPVQIVWRAAEN